jgi:hypothetical protein
LFFSTEEEVGFGGNLLDTEVSTVLVDFSASEKENYSDKGTYGKGYCYRVTDFKKFSDESVLCDSTNEKECPMGTSMAFRDLSQPMCEDLHYIRSKGFLAHERGVWVPYKRRKEKPITSMPKVGLNLGAQVKLDRLATEPDYGIKVSSQADDVIQYKLEYEYCNEDLVVGFGDLGDNHCQQAHKFEVGISSVLYGSEAVMDLTGQYTADRQGGADNDGRVMLRFSKPLYGMFGVFSLN